MAWRNSVLSAVTLYLCVWRGVYQKFNPQYTLAGIKCESSGYVWVGGVADTRKFSGLMSLRLGFRV